MSGSRRPWPWRELVGIPRMVLKRPGIWWLIGNGSEASKLGQPAVEPLIARLKGEDFYTSFRINAAKALERLASQQ